MKNASVVRPRGHVPWALLPLLAACGDSTGAGDAGSAPLPDLGLRFDMGAMAQPDAAILDGGFVDAGETPDMGESPADLGSNPMDMGGSVTGCPPQAPFGTGVGETFPEIQLPDCDGVMQSLHASCDKKASYFFVYADW